LTVRLDPATGLFDDAALAELQDAHEVLSVSEHEFTYAGVPVPRPAHPSRTLRGRPPSSGPSADGAQGHLDSPQASGDVVETDGAHAQAHPSGRGAPVQAAQAARSSDRAMATGRMEILLHMRRGGR